jgi:hypothetical protein
LYNRNIYGLILDRDMGAAIKIRKTDLMRVGDGIPEFTPVEIPLAGYLSRRGISQVLLKQEPPSL